MHASWHHGIMARCDDKQKTKCNVTFYFLCSVNFLHRWWMDGLMMRAKQQHTSRQQARATTTHHTPHVHNATISCAVLAPSFFAPRFALPLRWESGDVKSCAAKETGSSEIFTLHIKYLDRYSIIRWWKWERERERERDLSSLPSSV